MKKNLLLLGLISLFALTSYAQVEVELVKDIHPTGDGNPHYFAELNNQLLFFAADESDVQLWTSDGTGSGTQLLKIINPDGDAPETTFTKYNGKLYFGAYDGEDYGIWATDGTSNGTTLVINNVFPVQIIGEITDKPFFEFNGKLYFNGVGDANGEQLWVTDGTEQGTQLVKVINPTDDASLLGFTELNGKLYFFANEEDHGYQLWETDGTTAGTQRVALINPNGSGFINSLPAKYNNKIYFMGDDGENGIQLWVSDGTESGTQLLKIIYTGGSQAIGFKVFNGELYFFASDGTLVQLWKTDGTTTGTNPIIELNIFTAFGSDVFEELNGKLYFAGIGGDGSSQLWVTDGTTDGTQLVKEINPNGNSYPSTFTKLGNNIYFIATKGDNNYELFKSDGTEEGTIVISPDIAPNPSPCFETYEFFEFNDALYFGANYTNIGQELYKIIDHSISIKEQPELVRFSVYPNPTTDKLTIKTEKNTSFTLLDLTGKILLTFEVNQEKEISIAELNTGVYILKDETTGSHKKIVKY